MDETFFIDGKYVTSEQCRELFGKTALGERQNKCMKMLEGNLIVDIGCYAGGFIARAQKEYPEKQFVGIDYYLENIRLAKFLNPGIQDRFVQMSVYDLEFEDSSIDCITFQEVIEHLEGAAIALKEINRVLRPGGTLILSTNNAYYWKDKWFYYLSEIKNRLGPNRSPQIRPLIYFENVEWNRHIYCWTPATLMTLLHVNGFEYVQHEFAWDFRNPIETALLRLFPFLAPIQIFKVRKAKMADKRLI